jgi:gas vesicle protein
MSLEQKDLELIEHLIYKSSDDIAISIARSFERLEKSGHDTESRIFTRLGEIEDKIESSRQDMADTVGDIKEEIRDVMRFKLDADFERV